MPNFPPVLVELWEAISKIVDKLTVLISKLLSSAWGTALWFFEKFVDLIQYIADKI